MSTVLLQEARHCTKCGRAFNEGRRGLCPACMRRKRHPKRRRPVRCDCGQEAVAVIQVQVGVDPQYTIRLPLCQDCLKLEQGWQT